LKALTICQPYPELILRGAKRVENREWPTAYRGAFLIHAGKSRKWLSLSADGQSDDEYEIPLAEMAFGAIVGRCTLADCVHIGDYETHQKYPWLREHQHANGPWCWVLSDVVRFANAIPYRGALGLFQVPDDVLRDAKVAA